MKSAYVDGEKAWYAVRTKPRHEKAAARALDALGQEPFLPLRRDRRRWSDRVKSPEVPLFPGYLFCRFCWEERRPIVTSPGITSIVSFGGKPSPVDPTEIGSLQRVVASGMPIEAQPFLAIGTRVRIRCGVMEGVEGILAVHKNQWRVVVTVTLLQRSVGVEVDREWVTMLA